MRGRMVMALVAAMVLALAGAAGASHEGQLDRDGLAKEAKINKALARYLKHNGYPDMAEVKRIVDQPPWDQHEVVLYYLKNRKEIAFARARVLGRPDVHSTRYERVMTDADIRALRSHGGRLTDDSTPGGSASNTAAPAPVVDSNCTGSAAARAECSAGRAENAADRVDVAAVRAEKAADRTEAVVEKMAAHRNR